LKWFMYKIPIKLYFKERSVRHEKPDHINFIDMFLKTYQCTKYHADTRQESDHQDH
jgi:hypothetical protein